jgi:hypothetical protein
VASLNVATMIGNSPPRIAALGWDDVLQTRRLIDARVIDGMPREPSG